MQWSALEKCWPKLGLPSATTGWNGSELVHKGIRNVTLALLPLTQVGNGPRGLARPELGDRKLDKEQVTLQMTSSRS